METQASALQGDVENLEVASSKPAEGKDFAERTDHQSGVETGRDGSALENAVVHDSPQGGNSPEAVSIVSATVFEAGKTGEQPSEGGEQHSPGTLCPAAASAFPLESILASAAASAERALAAASAAGESAVALDVCDNSALDPGLSFANGDHPKKTFQGRRSPTQDSFVTASDAPSLHESQLASCQPDADGDEGIADAGTVIVLTAAAHDGLVDPAIHGSASDATKNAEDGGGERVFSACNSSSDVLFSMMPSATEAQTADMPCAASTPLGRALAAQTTAERQSDVDKCCPASTPLSAVYADTLEQDGGSGRLGSESESKNPQSHHSPSMSMDSRLKPRPPALALVSQATAERSQRRSQSMGACGTDPSFDKDRVRSDHRHCTFEGSGSNTSTVLSSPERSGLAARDIHTLTFPYGSLPGSDSETCPQTPTVLRHLVDEWNFAHPQRGRANSTVSHETNSNSSRTGRGKRRFRKSDLEAGNSAKGIMRRTSLMTEDKPSIEATPDLLEKVLQDEKRRLKTKASSRAFENDLNQVKMERALLKKKDGPKYAAPPRQDRDADVFAGVAPDNRGDESFIVAKSQHLDTMRSNYLGWVGCIKWTATAVIALIIAMQAGVIILGAYYIGVWKVGVLETLSHSGSAGHALAYLFLLFYGLPAGFVSAVLVSYVAPHAGGSGIPEIKSYLNGIASPQAFSFKTWLSRSIGLVLVTSAGLFAGTEGPFAHLGGIVASGMAEGPRWKRLPWPLILRGHRNRCEFISQGAAMGVAAAFGAPIGGILFSLEEASTFWSKTLTWQAFLGTMIAAVVAKLIKSGFTGISGGGFIEFPDKNASFEIWELFTFGLMAAVMGLLGALFCALVRRCISFRRRMFQLASPTPHSRRARVLEVLCVVFFSISICFWPSVMSGCVDLEPQTSSQSRHLMGGHSKGKPDLSGGICSDDSYSDVGYILLQPKEAAIKALFSNTMESGATLKIPSLILCYIIIFGTTIVTFGSAIPVGLFIPNILGGACFGRAIGQAFLEVGIHIRPDVYALVGAAAALAGFSRMTISLAVIFVEITNNTYLGLPLMLVIMVSKMVGDKFTPSVYDIVLELNPDIHLLEDNMSEDHLLVLDSLTAHDVCTAEVVVVREFEPLPQILSLLMRTSFAGYPVVDRQNQLTGLVTRTQLATVVEQAKADGDEVSSGALIRIQPLCETPPEITLWNTPVVRSFHHFRASGLQHMCVVGQSQELVGILTRTDFSRLCHHGPQGIDHVRMLMERKREHGTEITQQESGILNSQTLSGLEPCQMRGEERIPTGSTVYSASSEHSGISSDDNNVRSPNSDHSSAGSTNVDSSPEQSRH